jgi:hypothetical protein
MQPGAEYNKRQLYQSPVAWQMPPDRSQAAKGRRNGVRGSQGSFSGRSRRMTGKRDPRSAAAPASTLQTFESCAEMTLPRAGC